MLHIEYQIIFSTYSNYILHTFSFKIMVVDLLNGNGRSIIYKEFLKFGVPWFF